MWNGKWQSPPKWHMVGSSWKGTLNETFSFLIKTKSLPQWALLLSVIVKSFSWLFFFPCSYLDGLQTLSDPVCFTFFSYEEFSVPFVSEQTLSNKVFNFVCTQVQEPTKRVWLIYHRVLPWVKTILLRGKFFLFKRTFLFLRAELWF